MSDGMKCRGVIVPMVSPFTPDGQIDPESVHRIVDHLIAGSIDGIFVLGTTGEAASISATEKKKIIEIVADYTKNRAIVYAGISSNCLNESLSAAKCYMDLGVDVLVAHSPCYYSLYEDEIFKYFMKLADCIAGPLMLYNIPKLI